MSKVASLQALYALLDKEIAPGAGRPMMQRDIVPVERISTGSPLVDWATHGGIPRGRITEFYGSESSGKTSLALSTIGQAQRAGLRVAYIDAEHSFDPEWAALHGVNIDEMMYVDPDYGEQVITATRLMAESKQVHLVVVDSVAALVPKAEMEGDVGESHIGKQARLMSQAMRMLNGPLKKHECAAIFINQMREKVGVQFGNPETTTGGRALRYYASVRLDMRVVAPIKEKDEQIGVTLRVRCSKNKLGRPYRKVEVPLLYAKGFDMATEVFALAVSQGRIERAGAYYKLDGESIGQGKEQATTWLSDHSEIVNNLRMEMLTS